MQHYAPEALIHFHHNPSTKSQHQPHLHVKPIYGATKQYAHEDDASPPLDN
jgi:hypothetical protein